MVRKSVPERESWEECLLVLLHLGNSYVPMVSSLVELTGDPEFGLTLSGSFVVFLRSLRPARIPHSRKITLSQLAEFRPLNVRPSSMQLPTTPREAFSGSDTMVRPQANLIGKVHVLSTQPGAISNRSFPAARDRSTQLIPVALSRSISILVSIPV